MSEVISKALLCGLGLASLTKDAIQKTAEDLVKQSKISEEEGRKLIKDLQRRSELAQRALEKHVNSGVHKLLQNLDLAAIINDRLKDVKPATKTATSEHCQAHHKLRPIFPCVDFDRRYGVTRLRYVKKLGRQT